MYFVQQWYALADEAVEDAVYDSQSRLNPLCGVSNGERTSRAQLASWHGIACEAMPKKP